MPSTAEQIKNIILQHAGRARKQQIARELNLGLDYIGLVCLDLKRKGEIAFLDGLYSLETAESKSRKSRPRVLRRQHKQEKFISQVDTKPLWSDIPKMTKRLMAVVEGAGYKTIESLADAPVTRFMQETKLELPEAAGLINQVRKTLNKIGE